MTAPARARFGTVVYEMGLIDASTLDATTVKAAEAKRPHADILLEAGTITAAQRDLVLTEQVRRRVHHLFTFPASTTFSFREGSTSSAQPAVYVDLLAPVWRGLRDFPPDVRTADVLDRIAPHALTLVSEAVLVRAELSPEERATCELLARQSMTIAALAHASPLDRERLELLVYFLLITRCAEANGLAKPAVASSAMWTAVRPAEERKDTPFAPISAQPSYASSERLTAAGGAYQRAAAMPTPEELGADAIVARARTILDESPHEVLGLAEGASSEAARAAYFRLARAWNPTRLPSSLEHVRPSVERIHDRMADAHRRLTDPTARAQG